MRNITKEIVAKWLKEKKFSDGKGKFPGEYPTRIWLRIPEKKFEYFGKPTLRVGLRLRRSLANIPSPEYIAIEFDRNGLVYSVVQKFAHRTQRFVLPEIWAKYHPDVNHDQTFVWLQYNKYRKSAYRNGIYGKRKAERIGI